MRLSAPIKSLLGPAAAVVEATPTSADNWTVIYDNPQAIADRFGKSVHDLGPSPYIHESRGRIEGVALNTDGTWVALVYDDPRFETFGFTKKYYCPSCKANYSLSIKPDPYVCPPFSHDLQ